jgi:two-component system NarL family sensor kinase
VSIAPPKLHEEGLIAALSDLAATARTRGVRANLDVPDLVEVGPTTETLLYRAAQEAARNTLEHGDATELTIRVAVDPQGSVHLDVSDDGVVIAAGRSAETNGDHLGLRLLAELVDEAGGRLDIRSEPGHGTIVALAVPAQ